MKRTSKPSAGEVSPAASSPSLQWSKDPPKPGDWYYEWTGRVDDAPEMVLICLELGSSAIRKGWYRGCREPEPLLGGPYYAGPIVPPSTHIPTP